MVYGGRRFFRKENCCSLVSDRLLYLFSYHIPYSYWIYVKSENHLSRISAVHLSRSLVYFRLSYAYFCISFSEKSLFLESSSTGLIPGGLIFCCLSGKHTSRKSDLLFMWFSLVLVRLFAYRLFQERSVWKAQRAIGKVEMALSHRRRNPIHGALYRFLLWRVVRCGQ